MDLATFLQQHPFISAFVFGVLVAARQDYNRFKQFATDAQLTGAIAKYDWWVAVFRWADGGITAVLTALLGDSAIRNAAAGLL